jgi:ferrous iron transport protein A
MTRTLRDLVVGQEGTVAGYREGGTQYRQKLLAMGLTPGTRLRVVRVAPLGDPVEIKVRGFSLSLRKDEADAVQIEGSDT